MNNSMLLTSILLLALGLVSCSKEQGKTSTTFNIVHSKSFTAALSSSKTNNGLILFGKNQTGQSFLKRIASDSVDVIFPNGIWDFYAVSWENASDANYNFDLRGKVYCGKSIANKLVGGEVAINLSLLNENCDQAFHSNPSLVGGEKRLGKISLYSCKDISGVSDFSSTGVCKYDLANNVDNKGYATYLKVVVPEYSSFVSGLASDNLQQALSTKCMAIDKGVEASLISDDLNVYLSSFNMPQSGLNGFRAEVKVYYSKNGCDDSYGFTTIPLSLSLKKKLFQNVTALGQTIDRYFLEVDASGVCLPPRNSSNTFASGLGLPALPYTICNEAQYNLINLKFNDDDGGVSYANRSYDLLADLNFKNDEVSPIGSSTVPFTGNFNGRNHRIENFIIKCPNSNINSIGLFRFASSGEISNLTINKAIINCDQADIINNEIGMLVGTSKNNSFKNIKAFGMVSGDQVIGGLVGNALEGSKFFDVHVEASIKGQASLGGLVGKISHNVNYKMIHRSSFNGDLESTCTEPCESVVGGLVGDAIISGTSASINESVAYFNKIKGSKIIGGLVGRSDRIDLYDNIAKGLLISSTVTDGIIHFVQMGGLIGLATAGTISRNIAYTLSKSNKFSSDTSLGVLIGGQVATPTCSTSTGRNFGFGQSFGTLSCNVQANLAKSLATLLSTYQTSNFANDYPNWVWPLTEQGTLRELPRLAWEILKEKEVPYLKRKCSGLYASSEGDGSALNPFSICTKLQFESMLPNKYYKLYRSIDWQGESLNMLPSGVYHLDGDNHGIIDFAINNSASVENIGVFRELQSGSVIKNLKIVKGSIVLAQGLTFSTNMNVGLLAGTNNGILKDIKTVESSFNSVEINLLTSAKIVSLGGIVGINQSEGVINNFQIDHYSTLNRPKNFNSVLMYGGIAGQNNGVIKIGHVGGSLSRLMGDFYSLPTALGPIVNEVTICSMQGKYFHNITDGQDYFCSIGTVGNVWKKAYRLNDNEFIASLVAINNGLISEVESNLSIKINDINGNSAGVVAPIIGKNLANAVVEDIFYSGSFQFSFHNDVEKIIFSNLGLVNRVYFAPQALSSFKITNGLIRDGFMNDVICGYGDGGANCFNGNISLLSVSGDQLSFGDGVSTYNTMTPWNVSLDLFSFNSTTWVVDNDNNLKLMNSRKIFSSLGSGF